MKIGKLDINTLEEIILNPINQNNFNSKETLVKANVGEDCCALKIDEEYVVLSTDPITATSKSIGKLVVNINVNDIVSSGAIPIGILVTILLPENTTKNELKSIIDEIYCETNKLNIEVLGGHTEVTDAVNRPVISCTIIGKTKSKKFISTSGAKAGQSIVMTKWAGIEGTEIILNEKEDEVKSFLNDELFNEAKNLGKFLSVLKEANIALEFEATCMHDVTEGGVLGACFEICKASNCGANIFIENIPILKSTKNICEYFKINPYKLISSGVLLITTFNAELLVCNLKKNNINASIIGTITEDPSDRFVYFKDKKEILSEPDSDEIYKINFD